MSQPRTLLSALLILIASLAANAQNGSLKIKSVKIKRGLTLSLSQLTALDSVHAQVGDEVTAKLDRPLVAEGVTVLPTEWIVHGTVTKVKRAGKNCHAGEVKWALESVITPKGDRLRVQRVYSYRFDPNHIGDPDWVPLDTAWTKSRHAAAFTGVVVIFVALSPFMIPMAIGMAGDNPCHGEAGTDTVLEAGTNYLYAVSKDARVAIAP